MNPVGAWVEFSKCIDQNADNDDYQPNNYANQPKVAFPCLRKS